MNHQLFQSVVFCHALIHLNLAWLGIKLYPYKERPNIQLFQKLLKRVILKDSAVVVLCVPICDDSCGFQNSNLPVALPDIKDTSSRAKPYSFTGKNIPQSAYKNFRILGDFFGEHKPIQAIFSCIQAVALFHPN